MKVNSIFFKTVLFFARSTHVGTGQGAPSPYNPPCRCQRLAVLKEFYKIWEPGLLDCFNTSSRLFQGFSRVPLISFPLGSHIKTTIKLSHKISCLFISLYLKNLEAQAEAWILGQKFEFWGYRFDLWRKLSNKLLNLSFFRFLRVLVLTEERQINITRILSWVK